MRNSAISFTLALLSSSQIARAWSNKPLPEIFGPQVFQSTDAGVTHEICSRSMDRLLHKNIDFNTVLREDTGEWKDETFSFPHAIFWDDMRPEDPYHDLSYAENDGFWLRISDIFDANKYSLFGDNGIQPSDAKQGHLGDCWLVSAAACVAQEPERIKDMFQIQELNSAGIYALKLYLMGIPVTVSVDEYLPFYGQSPDRLSAAKSSKDNGLWMPILEKAAAKLFGNYEMLIAGLMGPAVQMMTGAPYYYMTHADYNPDELWQNIKEKIVDGWMVTCASKYATGSDQDQNGSGISNNHAFTVLDAQELDDGTKLLKVRNPWGHGRETYSGDFADIPKSDRWNDHPNFPGYHEEDDGVWWTTAEIYQRDMSWTSGNPDVRDEKMSYFALFDINGHFDSRVEMTSDDEQTVYISAYTYNLQHIKNGACNKNRGDSKFYFKHDRTDEWITPLWDKSHHMPLKMSAGETLGAYIDLYFDENDLRAHDISIVVQAEKSPIKISIQHEEKSEEFPQYQLSPDVTINPMRNREHSDGTEPDPLPDEEDAVDDDKADDDQGDDAGSDTFDSSSIPHYTESLQNPFNQYFQFAPGSNWFYQMNSANGENTLYQETYLLIDGETFYSGANVEYQDTKLKVTFADLMSQNSVIVEMTAPSGCSDWKQVMTNPFEAYVKVCRRTDSDPQWAPVNADWSLVYWAEPGETWMSSYFKMDTSIMENGLWTGSPQQRLSTGIWDWKESQFQHNKHTEEEFSPEIVECDGGYTRCTLSDWTQNGSGYAHDYKVTFNETIAITDKWNVKDPWQIEQTIEFEVGDSYHWVVNEFIYTGELWHQKLSWDGGEDAEFQLSRNKESHVMDTYMGSSSSYGYTMNENVNMNSGYNSISFTFNGDGWTYYNWQTNFYFDGRVSIAFLQDGARTIWSKDSNLSDTEWNPLSEENYGSRMFLLSKGEGAAAETEQEQESGTTTALIATASTFGALAAASYMAKRKEAVRTDTDQFIRA